MNQAINAYYNITAESEFREKARLWEKARHDEATALYYERQEGIAEGKLEIARNMLAKGSTYKFIHEITGLPLETIENL